MTRRRVLLSWEVGAGLGHARHLLSIALTLRARGWDPVVAAAMGWFDLATATGRHMSDPFEHFCFPGPHNLRKQLAFVTERLDSASGDTFTFINVGETHVPYWHEGAPWEADDNPCVPFQVLDRAADCRHRQRACLEYADRLLGPLIERHRDGTILVCGDHGDCWGEDGLWEHGIAHPMTLTVPLLIRHRGEPVVDRRDFPTATDAEPHSISPREGEMPGRAEGGPSPNTPPSVASGDISPSKGGDRRSGGDHSARPHRPPARSVAEVGVMPHAPVPPRTRANARRMRHAMTPAELKLWNAVRAHRLAGLGFRRQMPVAGFIADFACPQHRLIVELDGSGHGREKTAQQDAGRTRTLEAAGWHALRFTNEDALRDIDGVCRHILILAGEDA